jgi:hypothetical protein
MSMAVMAGAVAFAAGVASADAPVPHQRAGLWETSMTMMGRPFLTQSCIDAASEEKMSVFSSQLRHRNCKSGAVTHNADGSWTAVSVCEFTPGNVSTTRAIITGDFNSRIAMAMHTDRPGMPDMQMTMTWQGPCKPGMRGGDVIMGNGMKMNMLDAPAAQ